MLVIDSISQGTPEWFTEKLGKPSASRFNEILTSGGGVSKQRQGYMYELAAQAVSGMRPESYSSPAMEEGIRREEESRTLYEMINDVEVSQVGLIYPNEERRYLCSPDGIINNEYGLELKNVLPKTQVKYLMSGGKLPTEYYLQCQGSLLITGFDRWDWMSYSPGLPALIIPVHRDDAFITKLTAELDSFCLELAITVKKLKALSM